jgi:hypothetical protein
MRKFTRLVFQNDLLRQLLNSSYLTKIRIRPKILGVVTLAQTFWCFCLLSIKSTLRVGLKWKNKAGLPNIMRVLGRSIFVKDERVRQRASFLFLKHLNEIWRRAGKEMTTNGDCHAKWESFMQFNSKVFSKRERERETFPTLNFDRTRKQIAFQVCLPFHPELKRQDFIQVCLVFNDWRRSRRTFLYSRDKRLWLKAEPLDKIQQEIDTLNVSSCHRYSCCSILICFGTTNSEIRFQAKHMVTDVFLLSHSRSESLFRCRL